MRPGTYPGGIVIVKDLTLEGEGEEAPVITKSHWDGIEVIGKAQVKIVNLQVSGNNWYGLSVEDTAQLTLVNSRVSNNRDGLRVWMSTQVTLVNSQVFGNRDDGLSVEDHAQVILKSSLIEGNGTDERCGGGWSCNGIVVDYKAQVKLTDTIIRNNNGWGISAVLKKCGHGWDHFQGTVLWRDRGNQIYGNKRGDVCLPDVCIPADACQ